MEQIKEYIKELYNNEELIDLLIKKYNCSREKARKIVAGFVKSKEETFNNYIKKIFKH